MTFPLMTGGVLRLRPERAGYTVAMLYFTNSLGAAVGVLASGFYFIGQVGLPGTIIAAGVVNLAVAALVLLLRPAEAGTTPAAPATAPAALVPGARLLLLVAGFTGFSSFLYEIGWIRMLALVLGSSTHAFELMLSALSSHSPSAACGCDAASTPRPSRCDCLPRAGGHGHRCSRHPAHLRLEFRRHGSGNAGSDADRGRYVAFNLFSHGIALAVMFPAAFCAGMTLRSSPLRCCGAARGDRHRQVYAANTAGAIAGVAAAVHLGFPLLGLKGMIVAGAVIDVALGVALFAAAGGRAPRAWATAWGRSRLVCCWPSRSV